MKNIFYLMLIMLVVSCGTMDKIHMESELKKAMLTGKVITEEGLPLEGVTVKMTNFLETKTDINGRFLYNFLSFGKYKITCEKEGYAKGEFSFEYNMKNRKLPFVKIKMFSLNYLVVEGFELLKEKEMEKARDILSQIKTIDNNEEIVLYFEVMYNYALNNYYEAMLILEKLKEEDRKNIYYQLTLVEVYEKQKLYEDEIKMCLYIARNNMKEYAGYLRRAALICKDNKNDQARYDELMKEYNDYLKNK